MESTSTTTTVQPEITCDSSNLEYVIIAVVILICCIFALHKIFAKKNHATVSVELISNSSCVTLPIAQVSKCPKYYHFQAETLIQNMDIKGLMTPTLLITWGNLEITNILNQSRVSLPNSIKLCPFKALKLKKILYSGSYDVFLFVQHANNAFYIQVCKPSCELCPNMFSTVSTPTA